MTRLYVLGSVVFVLIMFPICQRKQARGSTLHVITVVSHRVRLIDDCATVSPAFPSRSPR